MTLSTSVVMTLAASSVAPSLVRGCKFAPFFNAAAPGSLAPVPQPGRFLGRFLPRFDKNIQEKQKWVPAAARYICRPARTPRGASHFLASRAPATGDACALAHVIRGRL
jgi:hypothetical protein